MKHIMKPMKKAMKKAMKTIIKSFIFFDRIENIKMSLFFVLVDEK